MAAALFLGIFWTDSMTGKAAPSTAQQIQDTQKELNGLENELDETNEDLDALKGEHHTLKGQLDKLNSQLAAVSSSLEQLEQQIEDKNLEITMAQESLEQAKQKEGRQYDAMVIRIREMYERRDVGYLELLLSMGSFEKMLNAADFFEKIVTYDKQKLQEFKENRRLIEEQEARLQIEREELAFLKQQAEEEQNKVMGLIAQTTDNIAQYADQISDAEQKALEYEQKIKETENDLEALKKKYQEELAMSQAAAKGTWRNISEVTFAEGDRYLLANLIYCEAGGEPEAGQLAVGSVVINRVLSSLYPDTVVGVIYQSKQFSPVASGRLELALAADKATDSCYRAADQAMAGMTNVGSCVYFRTPVEGLTGISIGGHIFY